MYFYDLKNQFKNYMCVFSQDKWKGSFAIWLELSKIKSMNAKKD